MFIITKYCSDILNYTNDTQEILSDNEIDKYSSIETYTDKYLADVSGVTLGATSNCINFYFNNMLSYNSVVIKLRTQELGSERHQNVMAFIRRDLPINVTPIILT